LDARFEEGEEFVGKEIPGLGDLLDHSYLVFFDIFLLAKYEIFITNSMDKG